VGGRTKAVPKLTLKIWRPDENLYFADARDLEEVIQKSGRTDIDIRSRLGAGYSSLDRVLSGGGIDGWAASHMEWALSPSEAPAIGPGAMSGFEWWKSPKG